MIEQEIEIITDDGTIDGYLYRASDSKPQPGVIQLTDVVGLRSSNRDMARTLAAAGYTVLLPNVFYRTSRPPLFTFKPDFMEERTWKRMAELVGPLTPEAIERDACAYVDFLASQPCVADGALGVVGYCYTGGVALRMAAARPDKLAVCASFHGGGLFNDSPTSPHRVLPRVKAQLYFAHASNDRMMSAEAIQQLEQALRAWGGRYESSVYEGALHGWTSPDSPIYNPQQAERAFQKLSELLRTTLAR
jgi:carboxymethylenebutenolidase